MKLIDEQLLDSVTAQAKESVRLRMNYNFHDRLDAPAQRLLNALEPETVLPIHHHTETAETYVLLRGRMKVLYFDDKKNLVEECELNPKKGRYGVHIPKGQWHTIEVLESGTVLFEVKDGPYRPLEPGDVLAR